MPVNVDDSKKLCNRVTLYNKYPTIRKKPAIQRSNSTVTFNALLFTIFCHFPGINA